MLTCLSAIAPNLITKTADAYGGSFCARFFAHPRPTAIRHEPCLLFTTFRAARLALIAPAPVLPPPHIAAKLAANVAAMCSAPYTRLRSKVARRGRRSPWYARAWQGIMPSGPLRRRQSAACHAPCVPDPAQKTKQILCARSKTRWLKHTRRLPARGYPSACRIKSCFIPCAPDGARDDNPQAPTPRGRGAGDVPPPCADGPLRRGRARWSRRPPAAAVHVLARCPALRGVASQPDFVVRSPASNLRARSQPSRQASTGSACHAGCCGR
jgi:hypothetical protein